LKICLFILTEYTNVTDTEADRQTDEQTPRSIVQQKSGLRRLHFGDNVAVVFVNKRVTLSNNADHRGARKPS